MEDPQPAESTLAKLVLVSSSACPKHVIPQASVLICRASLSGPSEGHSNQESLLLCQSCPLRAGPALSPAPDRNKLLPAGHCYRMVHRHSKWPVAVQNVPLFLTPCLRKSITSCALLSSLLGNLPHALLLHNHQPPVSFLQHEHGENTAFPHATVLARPSQVNRRPASP